MWIEGCRKKNNPNNQKQTTDCNWLLQSHSNLLCQCILVEILNWWIIDTTGRNGSFGVVTLSAVSVYLRSFNLPIIDMTEGNGSLETIMLYFVRASFPAYPKWYSEQFHVLMMSKSVVLRNTATLQQYNFKNNTIGSKISTSGSHQFILCTVLSVCIMKTK